MFPAQIPPAFDGAKFAAKYNLGPFDFHVVDGILYSPIENPDLSDCIITAADIDRLQRISLRRENAQTEAGLATQLRTVTPQQAVDYVVQQITNGVSETTALNAFDNATTFAAAKPILRTMLISIYRIVDILKLMARILIAMRDQIWPELPED
jgi:hypothetical protein